MAQELDVDLCVLVAAEKAVQIFCRCFNTGYVLAVDLDDAVAGEQPGLVGTGTRYHFKDVEGVVHHLELYAHAVERAFELTVESRTLRSGDVDGVRVEIGEHLGYGQLHEAVEIHGVDIARLDYVEYFVELGARRSFGVGEVERASEPKARYKENGSRDRQPEHVAALIVHFSEWQPERLPGGWFYWLMSAMCVHSTPARRRRSIPSARRYNSLNTTRFMPA